MTHAHIAQPWVQAWNQWIAEHLLTLQNVPAIPSQFGPIAGNDENTWKEIRNYYPKPIGITNFNSGAVSSSPIWVEQAMVQYYSRVNQAPSYFLWKVMEQGRELVRKGIAQLAGVSEEEIAFTRNTTEALNTLIFGIPLQKSEEVIIAKQDYSKAVIGWRQRALREGISLKEISLDLPQQTDEEIIQTYLKAITPQTKVVQVTQVINWNGQILPYKKLVNEIKAQHPQVWVLLDGAHGFALLDTDLSEIPCDFYVAPLHKWLHGPITSGMMMIRKSLISKIWPYASSAQPMSDAIQKFEEVSLVLTPYILAIGHALAFHWSLGRENKENRLRHLRQQLEASLTSIPLIWRTPQEEARKCGIILFEVHGAAIDTIESHMLHQHQIHVGTVRWETFQGIRLTPNIYTAPEDITRLSLALRGYFANVKGAVVAGV
ncbi:aminotransferase class V-fold PLP-dependent enzyme [Cytophagales bacterium LB-30]|uniref:Aminotransferase class V-fold PLP-dependent enzyme n=1 Tax=Shiella aurantiaca TaxID=3058365 RepID=A0ABT8F0N7_9BACT|nr:aminotransferase class V-fold PLP-dependent enzyme [Shiella aurantiaca]MDN4164002.1 aminotransferase class V-fold PLP-dependent enzyme [Shiella aurantiaca]